MKRSRIIRSIDARKCGNHERGSWRVCLVRRPIYNRKKRRAIEMRKKRKREKGPLVRTHTFNYIYIRRVRYWKALKTGSFLFPSGKKEHLAPGGSTYVYMFYTDLDIKHITRPKSSYTRPLPKFTIEMDVFCTVKQKKLYFPFPSFSETFSFEQIPKTDWTLNSALIVLIATVSSDDE